MSRTRDLKTDYDIYIRLITGNQTQEQVAEILEIDASAISKRVRRLIKEGVLKRTVRSSINVYTSGPGAKGFMEKAREYMDRGGNVASPQPLPPGRVSQDKPPLEYWQGKSPRAHNLQFKCVLSRRAPPRGMTLWEVPELPDSIDWNVVTPSGNNPWKTKGDTTHYMGEIEIPGWDRKASVHYTITARAAETVQVVLPAAYVLRDWLKDVDSIEEYLVGVAEGIMQHFRRAGWVIGSVEKTGRKIEYGFYMPILEFLRDHGAMQITDSCWVDFSTVDSQGKRPEFETNDPKEDDIPGAMEVFLNLPKLESAIQRSLEIGLDNRQDIIEIKAAIIEFKDVMKEMKEVMGLVRERVRPEDPDSLNTMFG